MMAPLRICRWISKQGDIMKNKASRMSRFMFTRHYSLASMFIVALICINSQYVPVYFTAITLLVWAYYVHLEQKALSKYLWY
jgi:hypothetical protein